MNECFHAKCGERAREAPVCPACKHNNTDVSIHQVDPGKARRDLEKCLSRRHVDRIPLPNSLSPSLSLSLSLFLSIPFFFLFNPPPSRWISNAISILPPSLRFAALPPLSSTLRKQRAYRVYVGFNEHVSTRVVADPRRK